VTQEESGHYNRSLKELLETIKGLLNIQITCLGNQDIALVVVQTAGLKPIQSFENLNAKTVGHG